MFLHIRQIQQINKLQKIWLTPLPEIIRYPRFIRRIFPIIYQLFYMDKQTTAIRKSFDQLTPNEYEHYFYVVRLLLIFPPDKQDARQYEFSRGDYVIRNQEPTTVIPKCMYDVFISIHASCCEHRTEYFPYWHRWLMIKYEQYLLKAHKAVLSSTLVQDQADRLLELAQKVNPNTTKKQIQDLLTALQTDYKKIIGNQTISYIPTHYWNVFQPNIQINYPLGFINKQSYNPGSYDNIDKLISIIWNQDSIYQINFTTRYNMKQLGYRLRTPPPNYTQHQQLLNNANFWQSPEKYPEQLQFAYEFVSTSQLNYLTYKQYLKRRQTENKGQNLNKLYFNVLDEQSVNYIFGGKGYNYYPNTQPSISTDTTRTDSSVFKNTRNNNIGYYAYSRTLYTKPEDFITKFTTTNNNSNQFSMQNPHNSMHNNQRYCMNDAAFSVTNPIFFAYHSLIDLMLEYKINEIKINQNDQLIAVNSTASYLGQNLQIHDGNNTNQRPEYNVNFKQNWQRLQEQSNQGKIPRNKDYPILKWISDKGSNPSQNITNEDFAIVTDYNYQKLLLDGNKLRNLTNIVPDTNISYSISNFDQNIKEIKSNIQIPYSASNLYVALQIRYRANIQSTNLNVQLKNMNGKILTTKTYPIFIKGERAGKCPNCTQFVTNKVLFPVEELKEHFTNLINIRRNGIFEESAFSQVESRVSVASSLSYNLSSKDVTARFVGGRQNLNILTKNADKDIKVYLKSEEKKISKSKAIETFRTKKPITFNAINGTAQKKVGTKKFNIIGAQAQLNGKTINYNFQFFSEESEIVFDFSKDGKNIGLSEKPCIGQNLNNVYELTTESTPQIKQKMVEEKAEYKAEKVVKPKVQKITLTYKDFE